MPSRRAKLRLSGTALCVKSKCLAMSKRSSHYHETRLTGRRESRRSRLISGTSSSWKHTPTKSQILAAFLGRGWDKHSAEYCDFNEETRVTISFPTARPACSLPPADCARSRNSALLPRLLYSICPSRTRSHSRSDKEFGRKGYSRRLVCVYTACTEW